MLILGWPALLILGVAKLSSRGAVLLKTQIGLNGGESLVYKFRSRTVCEEGAEIAQAV